MHGRREPHARGALLALARHLSLALPEAEHTALWRRVFDSLALACRCAPFRVEDFPHAGAYAPCAVACSLIEDAGLKARRWPQRRCAPK